MPTALLRRVWNIPAAFRRARKESTKWFRGSRSPGHLHREVFDGLGNKGPRTEFVPQRAESSAAAIHQAGWQTIGRDWPRFVVKAASK